MIHSLKLVNFRKHASLSVDFTAGMNGIFGPNYTGKTTILYGILFCLGGISSVPCKSVYKSGTSTFLAEMLFSIGGKKYLVSRTKSSAKLCSVADDGTEEMLANSTSVVNRHVEKLLGMTMKRFCQIRYSRQKFTSALLTLGATELHNILSDVSGADFVQKVLDRLGKMKDRLEYELEGKVEQDIDLLQAQYLGEVVLIHNAEELLAEAVAASSQAAEALTQAVASVDSLASSRAAYAAYSAKKSSLTDELVRAITKVDEASAELAELPTPQSADYLAGLSEKVAALREEISAVALTESTLDKLVDRLSVSQKAFNAAKDKHEKTAARCSEVQPPERTQEMDDLAAAVEASSEVVRNLKVRIDHKKQALESGVCLSCNRPFNKHFDLKAEEEELSGLMTSLQVAMTDNVTAQGKLDLLNKVYNKLNGEYTESQADLKASEVAFSQASANLEEAKAELAAGPKPPARSSSDLRAELDSVREAVALEEAAAGKLARAAERHEEAKAAKETVAAKLNALEEVAEVPAADYEAAKVTRDGLAVAAEQAAAELRVAEMRLSDCKTSARTAESALEVAKDTNAKLEKLFTRSQSIKALVKFLKESKDEYMREVWNVLMADATQLVIGASGGDIDGLERTEDGQFSYTEDGVAYNVSEASGAQAAIMGLAVQTALARALPPVLDVLLVDEPTSDMDDEHSMTFSLLLPSRAAQVICVSHSRMDSSTCNNVIDLGG